MVRRVKREKTEQQVILVPKGNRAQLVQMARRVKLVPRALKARRVKLVPRDLKDKRVKVVLTV
jgi:hypothetical protein